MTGLASLMLTQGELKLAECSARECLYRQTLFTVPPGSNGSET
jgi:hypothetical protein